MVRGQAAGEAGDLAGGTDGRQGKRWGKWVSSIGEASTKVEQVVGGTGNR